MQISDVEFTALPINPDRFCEAISKIGYRPAAAIMDIVDNAVAAKATCIKIQIQTRAGTTNSASGNVEVFRIFDNGVGMSGGEINTALEIGSDVQYEAESLSKFGLGLKSAGFSLGRRIEVSSRKSHQEALSKFVDRDIIKERKEYGVCPQILPPSAAQWFANHASGTVIEISKTIANQDSAGKIRRELQNKLGVTYYTFLSAKENPLRIVLAVNDEAEEVPARDILFWGDAAQSFDPDNYDASRPCMAFDGTVGDDLFSESTDKKVKLKIAIFPKDQMKKFAGFSEDQKKRVAGYDISRENSGFFFYRNGRLIRWGDKGLGGVGRDDIGFRARVDFSTEHDEMLHVDVSKQHLVLSEGFEANLKILCRVPLSNAKLAFKICDKMVDVGAGDEGAAFNERTEVFQETDPVEEIEPVAPEVKAERRAILETETKEREQQEGASDEAETSAPTEAGVPQFQRIRYSDKVMGLDVAVPGTDTHEGTYVRINRNHPFYDVAINSFDPSSPARLTIEALLWAAAVAEIKTVENMKTLTVEELRSAFNHFRRAFSQNLDMWVSLNQDLFQ